MWGWLDPGMERRLDAAGICLVRLLFCGPPARAL